MMPFDLVEPGSLGEALALLDPGDPSVRPLAGGTALMLLMKSGLFRPKRLISLRAAGERLSRVKTGTDGGLRIGAMVRLSTLERAPEIHRGFRVIARTLRTLANVRVRNVATLGGHLAHADPHADLPPVLIALGASIVAASPVGERIIPAEQFATGIYETALKGGELIVEVTLPPPGNWRAAYAKCTTRSADDWPALGVAVAVEVVGTAVKEARVVIGAAVERPVRLKSAEDLLRGKSLDIALMRQAGEAAAEEADVVADIHGSAAYKKQLVRIHVARALQAAWQDGDARP
jgi:carbon-monoxide dehydrogenase medium subunit